MLARETLEAQIAALRARLERIPYLDPIDLRFRNRVRLPIPTAKAVMFCLMDVSGSMDEARKDLSKRFFILLYLFLTRHYEKIDLVFIRHHTQAQEVDEENFFRARETGGTVVSSALVLMDEIITAALLARRLEHLRRPGERRRQLASRLRPLPRAPDREPAAEVPLLRLRAGGRGRAEPLGGVLPAAGNRARLRDAQGHRPEPDLPGVPRPLQERGGGGVKNHHPPSSRDTGSCPAPAGSVRSGRSRSRRCRPGRGRRRRCPIRATGPSSWSSSITRRSARSRERFALDTYPNQLEVITAEQMMDAYASVGMPVNYRHWSYGKEFIANERSYRRGQMGLAYEIVINSDPCISYLMEENTTAMQALVIAHAAYGHNSFFKGNYLFRLWTDASSIIDYLVYARNYIAECEEKYGMQQVEDMLDSCHALQNYGVDRYHRPSKLSLAEELARRNDRLAYAQTQVNDIWRTLPRRPDQAEDSAEAKRFPPEPQENILYFIEKNAPLLEPWQREVVRIVRKIAQYFYPQRQTQVMNEGWATFWHHALLNTLYDEGHLTDGVMIEWLKSHTNVIFQPPVGHPAYGGINPYALGFAMYTDLRRICEHPTDEDREWFPQIAGTPWLPALHHAMRNFKDESFIGQYLSPKVIRDLRLFSILDDEHDEHLRVSAIHDTAGYRHVREALSRQYDLGSREPDIQV